jgi:DNA-binding LacI/PurR family transcriptional regulator
MRSSRGTLRSGTIGVLSLDPFAHGKAPVLSGIQDVARHSDYCVSMISVRSPGRESLMDALQRFRGLGVDGILVLAPQHDAVEMLAEISVGVPLVVLDAPQQDVLSVVTTDHYAGAEAATRHLLELGHRSVFHIAGPLDGPEPGSRMAGWRDTLVGAGASVPSAMIGDGSPEAGYELGRSLASRSDVTAIFAASDQMALGVLRSLSEARRRVPEEVSVVGFGGTPEGEFFNPPLTTIRQNFSEVGRRGAELLRAEIEAGRLARAHETIPADLVLRASTAAAG